MVRESFDFLHITDDITKGQIDMVIKNVNNNLDRDNSKWYMRYDGSSADSKYFVSYEVNYEDIFLSFRISNSQYKNKYADIDNKNVLIKNRTDDTTILSINNNYNKKRKNGLHIFMYSKNLGLNDFEYLLNIFNKEFLKVGGCIKKQIRENAFGIADS